MGIFKNRVNVDDYLKASKTTWVYRWSNTAQEQGEYIVASGIVDRYRKENRFNLFRFFNETYRPYIKYGEITQISGKVVFSSLFLILLSISVLSFYKFELFSYLYISLTVLLFVSLFIHLKFRDKYDIAKEKYNEEKKIQIGEENK